MKQLSIAVSLAATMWACDGSSPTSPSTPSPLPAPIHLAVFTDPASGFSTSDLRDVDEQIVHFNSATELIWTADGTRFTGYRVADSLIRGPGSDDWFQIRFGTKNGERRAYLGWDDNWCHCPGAPATIVDLEVINGRLTARATDVVVPGA